MADFDVCIVGAGPAGCATAISLADFAPELRVCLADAPAGEVLRVGETVPPLIEPLLKHLGLWRQFLADDHCASYRTVSAWGSSQLDSNEFLLHAHQVGWRLDRARFDAMMMRAATRHAGLHLCAKVGEISFVDGRWRVACGGETHTARFAVDASGRAATVARSQGWRAVNVDKLTGCFVHVEGNGDAGEGLLIETFPDGWWYTAALPGHRRVIACLTDADLLRGLGIGRIDGWTRALNATRHVQAAASGARSFGPPRIRPAGSRILAGETTLPLICVGDAASCFDPASGQGIVKALRSGIFASYAIADSLRRQDDSGVRRYRLLVDQEFGSYRETLGHYYAREQRWPDRPFWRRRQSGAIQRRDRSSPVSPAAARWGTSD